MIEILALHAFDDNYIWLLRAGGHVAVVDPGDAAPVLDYLERSGDRLCAILATHHHGDHVGGFEDLLVDTAESLEITGGMGADMFMEATGLPAVVYPGIEKVIWEGRTLLSTVVVTARADAKMPVAGEVLQVRKARIVGAQGHSGHGNFPRVIECMASGMDMTRMSTKKIGLEELPENIIKLQTDRSECKITYVAK